MHVGHACLGLRPADWHVLTGILHIYKRVPGMGAAASLSFFQACLPMINKQLNFIKMKVFESSVPKAGQL